MSPDIDQVEKVRASTDKLSELIGWLVTDVIRGTAIKRMAFVLVIMLLFFNPLSATFFGVLFHFTTPSLYAPIYWIVTLSLATAAVLVGVLTTPRKQSLGSVSTRAIRGLIPFTEQKEDVELFARLQREQEIGEIATAISDPGFKIGYVSGDSGSGKTSLVHAGVAPRMHGCHTVVVELNDLDPIESIRESVGVLVAPDSNSASIADLLGRAVRAQGKPILLILDQFEQDGYPLDSGKRNI